MIIEIEEAVVGEPCDICEYDSHYYIPVIEKFFCRKCARKLAQVLRQGVNS